MVQIITKNNELSQLITEERKFREEGMLKLIREFYLPKVISASSAKGAEPYLNEIDKLNGVLFGNNIPTSLSKTLETLKDFYKPNQKNLSDPKISQKENVKINQKYGR